MYLSGWWSVFGAWPPTLKPRCGADFDVGPYGAARSDRTCSQLVLVRLKGDLYQGRGFCPLTRLRGAEFFGSISVLGYAEPYSPISYSTPTPLSLRDIGLSFLVGSWSASDSALSGICA